MKRIATLEWDVAKLAESMGLTMDALMEWSPDGRNLNKFDCFIENYLHQENSGVDANHDYWEEAS